MAYAELAESGAMEPDAAAREAKEAAAHAVRIDPQLGEAHTTAAYLKAIWDFDWAGAEAEFKRALELSPNSADTYDLYGRMCSAVARYDEAITLQRRAQGLDPFAHPPAAGAAQLRAGRSPPAAARGARPPGVGPRHPRGPPPPG